MLPDGTKLEVVATLAKFWGRKVANRCPVIEEVKVSKDAPAEGETIEASVAAKDPEGDKPGGEKVSFFMGGIGEDKAFHDTASRKLENVKLRKTWTRYRIPLDGEDLSQIKTGFGFNFGGQGRPFAFYLDDIEYVGD